MPKVVCTNDILLRSDVINHVVLLNWNSGVTEETILTVTNGFADLAKKIDEIKSYSFGPNMDLDGSNYQYALVAKFESLDDFNILQFYFDTSLTIAFLQFFLALQVLKVRTYVALDVLKVRTW